jgi:hypothetical protein
MKLTTTITIVDDDCKCTMRAQHTAECSAYRIPVQDHLEATVKKLATYDILPLEDGEDRLIEIQREIVTRLDSKIPSYNVFCFRDCDDTGDIFIQYKTSN